LPTALPVLNALFIIVFAVAIYALARHYGRRAAVVATVLGVFGWGLSYTGLFSALLDGTFSPYQNYIYQFGQMFGLPSIFDNLLQQRPLLMGLPVFALVFICIFWCPLL
jgi:vacuolar-type H+-ATPase subunit I/STV1